MSSEHLLPKQELDGGWGSHAESEDQAQRSAQRRLYSWIKPALIHFMIFVTYAACFSLAYTHLHGQSTKVLDLLYSPAKDILNYSVKFINNDVNNTNIYKGEPRPDSDEAWDNLFQYMNIRVTKDELERMNRSSVELGDGSGDYLAALDVLHHLHCLKLVRHYIHQDYYTIPDSVKVSTTEHIDHCVDAIRQELMCRAEVSMTTYEWIPDLRFPWAVLSYDHTCVDFEAILAWASTRVVDIFAPDMLVHPDKGPSYPNGPPKGW